MKEPSNKITQNFTDYFRAWTSVHVPSVYTNAYSFYETASKLVISLNELKDNQNLTSKQYDSLVEQVIPYLNTVREYMSNWRESFIKELNDYIQNRTDFEDTFKTWLLNYYNDFNQALKTKEQEFLQEINNYWNTKTESAELLITTGRDNLEAITESYKTKIDNWYNEFSKTIKDKMDNILPKYEALNTLVTNFVNSYKTTIESANTKWTKEANDFKTSFDELINTTNRNWLDLFITRYNYLGSKMQHFIHYHDFTIDILTWLNEHTSEFTDMEKAIFRKIDRILDQTPEDIGFYSEVVLANEKYSIGEEYTYEYTKLYRYNGNKWEVIADSNLYITSDYHVYFAMPLTNPIRTDQILTFTNEAESSNNYNTSAWYVPVCYGKYNGSPIINVLQQYNTAYFHRTYLDNEYHFDTYCNHPRGYGAYNLVYKNINNDFQRASYLTKGIYVCQTARGIFASESEDFPQIYNNGCQSLEPELPDLDPVDKQLVTREEGLTLVTGLYHINDIIVYDDNNSKYGIIRDKVKTLLPTDYMPRFTLNDTLYSFNHNSVYTIEKNGDTLSKLCTKPNMTILLNERDSLQIDDSETYIYSTKHVWLVSDFLTSVSNDSDITPIITIPDKIEHAHIFEDKLYTTHENYIISLKDKTISRPEIDIRANGIWTPDTSTWQNGYVYAGFYWQFTLINEESETVPHETDINYQNAIIGAKEIEYVSI